MSDRIIVSLTRAQAKALLLAADSGFAEWEADVGEWKTRPAATTIDAAHRAGQTIRKALK